MGFLDDMRRQAQAKADAEQKQRELEAAESERKWELQRRENELEQQRKAQAIAYWEKSDFPQMLEELSGHLQATLDWYPYGYRMLDLHKEGAILNWNISHEKEKGGWRFGKTVDDETYELGMKIEVTCTWEGVITVTGAREERLRLEDWLGHRERQEAALERAYRNPRRYRERYYKPTSDGGGSIGY